MSQSLALAVLLHIWLVLMFGNATGTARPGDGVWGRLNVTLSGSKSETGSGVPQPLSAVPAGPIGQAKQQRFGGTVRPLEDPNKQAIRPITPTTPGAAEVGNWQAQRVEAPAAVVAETPPSPALMMATPTALAPARQAPLSGLALAPAQAPTTLDQAPLPSARVMVMEATPAVALSRSKQEAIGRALEVPRRQTSVPSPLPMLPEFKPAAAAPQSAPLLPIAAEPAVPAPVPVPAPELTKQFAAPTELTRQLPSEVIKPLAPTSPAQAAAVAPLAALAASAVAMPTPTPVAASIQATSKSLATEANPAAASSVSAARPILVPAVTQQGSPEAGPRLGVDVATPASTPANAPRLNLNLPRARGGELSSRGSSGVLDLLPAPPDRKSKLSEDMEKAAKEDCRKAYGEQLGLLAVVPLVLDAAKSSKGCRW